MTTMQQLEKWTPAELIGKMLSAKWQPCPEPGKWRHPDGATIDLHAQMRDGRKYWHQLAERHVLPPSAPPPF